MDPAEERRDSKRLFEHINMLGFVADSEYGIPRKCPCGGRIIDEVSRKDEYDTHPGKRFFTCVNHQLWVIGVQEEIEKLTKRVEEAENALRGMWKVPKQIERLEEQVQILCGQVDSMTVQVTNLEKVCFE